ncbi:hypothetical protein [Paenibacillus montanisoli]|uniref:Uncharacterized protein n=1 Tax=Paenibacillus montanisoli TaxID=2081970 RepID=A0A328TZG9_9BACL|nr:hypothetical protein [Paenibacillus montanisoli]RAP75947.1 hypothetical protein DL346_10990 [Paenibacillus montanisoli]
MDVDEKAVFFMSCMICLLIVIGGCSPGKNEQPNGLQAIEEHGIGEASIYKSEGFALLSTVNRRTPCWRM